MDSQSPVSDSTVEQWRVALLEFDPTLPRPVAEAMVQNVGRGPLGSSLQQLEAGLAELERVRLDEITGSEARTVLAILLQLDRRVLELQSRIRQLWDGPTC